MKNKVYFKNWKVRGITSIRGMKYVPTIIQMEEMIRVIFLWD